MKVFTRWWAALLGSLALHGLLVLLGLVAVSLVAAPMPPSTPLRERQEHRIPVGLWTAPRPEGAVEVPAVAPGALAAGRSAGGGIVRAPAGAPAAPSAASTEVDPVKAPLNGAEGPGTGDLGPGEGNAENQLDRAAAEGAPAAAGRGPAPEPAPGGPAPDVEARVHARLLASAERCYPAVARRLRLQGTAEVRFCVEPSGALGARGLTAHSGAPMFDEAALGCVVPGAWPLDPGANGRCFTVPVRFGGRAPPAQLGP